MITRTIPLTGEQISAIGLGTWQTFDVSPSHYPALKEVVNIMHKAGGSVIDSSPMYGRAEEVVGAITSNLPQQNDFFYATKVWTQGALSGKSQIAASYRLMKREVMDLIQIHNLLDWQTHLPYLRQLKEKGKLRYIGITHYQDSSHDALAVIIEKEPIDFVQFNYSILSRHAEELLLPLCADKGVATLINRPFGEGALFRKVAHQTLPPWATDFGITNWGSYFLKFILCNKAVTCIIPATGDAQHAAENFEGGNEPLPDAKARKMMIDYVQGL